MSKCKTIYLFFKNFAQNTNCGHSKAFQRALELGLARSWMCRFYGNGFFSRFIVLLQKNILRHLQFVKTRVPNKKFPKPQYFNICEDSRFRFVYLSLNIYKYSHNI